jgi:AmmeMemoRadiSam system protein B
MMTLERPCLRPGLAAARDAHNPQYVVLWDRFGFTAERRRVTVQEFDWLQMFDGRRTLRDVQAEAMREGGSTLLPLDLFTALAQTLDEALFLDSPRFRERLAGPVREPSCIGCYEGEPVALRRQLAGILTGPKGPGLPRDTEPDGRLRAALIPHIDYARGGHTFAWGFKEVVERTDASLFVIVGTSHYSPRRFTLTRKHFKTPLGIAPTDQAYIDRLVGHYGDGLFDDEVTHLPEHSIELEVVWLQYLYEKRRPFRIVPILAGTFEDCVACGRQPRRTTDVGRMVEALRRAEAETPEPVCYIISGDLAHVGPKFDDPEPVSTAFLTRSRRQDQAILRQAEAADPAGVFQVIADERDCRRICGLPPTYTVLEAIRPARGTLLHYDQYVDPQGDESVSFASVAFYR